MTNSLIILILMAAILLLISFVISKSSLPENDKVMSLIVILVVFSMVAILNETKRSSMSKNLPLLNNNTNETQRFSSKVFERTFYEFPANAIKPQISSKGLNFDEEFAGGFPRFLVLHGNGKIGKTSEILSLVDEMQNKGIPSLYINCQGAPISLNRFLSMIKLENFYVLDDLLEKMNKIDKVPFIILDNYQGHIGESCEVCGLLAYFYERRNVNVVVLTNNGFVLEELKNDGFLMKIIEIQNLELKNEKYNEIINTLNSKFNGSTKIINETQLEECQNLIELDYEIFNEYAKNETKFENFTAFCNYKLKEIYDKLNLQKFKALLNGFFKDSIDFERVLSYGELKSQKIENFDENLEEAIRNDILHGENGKYKITKKSIYNALIER